MNNDCEYNRQLVYHRGMLKKFIDSHGSIITMDVQKIYHVNIVFQLQRDSETEYHLFRLTMTIDGVVDITEL